MKKQCGTLPVYLSVSGRLELKREAFIDIGGGREAGQWCVRV